MPDGIFAVNDPVAIGAMKTLQKNKIRIPEDMAVVGFSESKEAFIVEPNLTSVEQPTLKWGGMLHNYYWSKSSIMSIMRIKCCRSRLFWMQN